MKRPPTSRKEWQEFLESLKKHRVRYLVVGAHALAALGRPRYTGDLDVFIDPSPANAQRTWNALVDFGFANLPEEGASYFSYTEEGLRGVSMGFEPLRIDVLKSLSGITFAEAWRGRRRARMFGVQVYAIGRAAYLKNKRVSGRPKDLLDIALLEEAKPRRR